MERLRKISNWVTTFIKKLKNIFKGIFNKKLLPFVDKRPLFSFFALLILIVLLIVLGNQLRKPEIKTEEMAKAPKEVEMFSIAGPVRMSVSGTVEKTGVIQIIAQTAGVVQKINVTEGKQVLRGSQLFSLSTNYQGANISSVSRVIAYKNVELVEANYPLQLEMLNKRREIAQNTDTNQDKLREISAKSIDETKTLISLDEEILKTLDDQIKELEDTNVGGVNDAAILQSKQAKAGVLTALNGLKSQLRTIEYQSSGDNEPAKLSDLTRELTLKQLEIEARSLELSREISHLNLKIAKITESLSYPVSPGPGVIEKIHVNVGQAVNPGMVLATITCDINMANVIVSVSKEVAEKLSRLETTQISISGQTINLVPRYVSKEPINGTLYQVIFTLPEELGVNVGNKETVAIQLPIGQAQAVASIPFVPIDAVFQTETTSLIYVAQPKENNTYQVEAKEVTLGDMLGGYVQVLSGIGPNDQIVLDRSVIAGDEIVLKI